MFKRYVSTLMVIVTLLCQIAIPASASETVISDVDAMCANLENESVTIDGITYTYHYYFTSDGNRAIDVTYSNSARIDTVIYNASTSKLMLNGNVVGLPNSGAQNKVMRATTGWETLDTDVVSISWDPGIGVGLLAAMIAGAIGVVTSSAVVGALGSGLAYLATQEFSATIYLDSQWMYIPPSAPQYRMVWTLVDSSGNSYGPYISHYTV